MNLKDYITENGGLKIRVTPEQSEKIQQICFDNGIFWNSGEKSIKNLDCTMFYIGHSIMFGGIAIIASYDKDDIKIQPDEFIFMFGRQEKQEVFDEVVTHTKPPQYQIGIDTFERSKANQSPEMRVEIAKFMIDKYNWRNKGQDMEDFEKIKDYCDFAIQALKEIKND